MENDLVGREIGQYRILELVGTGGMAMVYKAIDTHLDHMVAIKIIRPEKLASDQGELILQRFKRELKALAHLDHVNIVKVTDSGEFENQTYLVMPYYSGGTLKQKLGASIPWMDASRILLPIAGALDYAHKHGVIHRDVKPSNILIDDDGGLMLTDFGVAKILNPESQVELTSTDMTVGTYEYMAPEQITSKNIDPRADEYAFGLVLYEMVAGRKPFEADTPGAIMIKQVNEAIPRPKTLIENLPLEVDEFLCKILAKKPDDRYETMKGVILALEGLLDGYSPQDGMPPGSKGDADGGDVPPDEASTQTNAKTSLKLPSTDIVGPCLLTYTGQVYEIRGDEIFIGRLDEKRGVTNIDVDLNDLDLEMSASRKHARIFCSRGIYHLADLGSTNGTRLNGKQLKPGAASPLKHQDRIQIGDINLIFSLVTD